MKNTYKLFTFILALVLMSCDTSSTSYSMNENSSNNNENGTDNSVPFSLLFEEFSFIE